MRISILSFFLLFWVTSCNKTVDDPVIVTNLPYEEVIFPSDPPFRNFYYEGWQSVKIGGQTFLYTYDSKFSLLTLFNSKSKKGISIPLYKGLPDGFIEYLLGLHIYENRLIIKSNLGLFLYELNLDKSMVNLIRSYTVKKGLDQDNPFEIQPPGVMDMNMPSSSIPQIDGNFFIPVYGGIPENDPDFFSQTKLLSFNGANGRISTTPLVYPSNFLGTFGTNYPRLFSPYLIQNDNDQFIVNYQASDSLFFYDAAGRLKQKKKISNYTFELPEVKQVEGYDIFRDSSLDAYEKNAPRFFPLHYDPKGEFYAIVYKKQTQYEKPQFYWNRFGDHTLLILDNDFSVRIAMDFHESWDAAITLNEEGLYIPFIQQEVENELVFHLIRREDIIEAL
jgi:hypothetical protein